ncbi:calcium/sodium antiporter [Teredinibacter turnerae]|uniref:calcium/sodium antiporter n=1 Tax=Teredinibacter turnerae TaxID=2426 RepID=UPI00036F3FEC|nr:calcium/sodium antiporter [Teredinibacter turnerae]
MLESLPPLLVIAFAIVAGFAGLIWSADRFVAGSAAIASSFGVAPVVIGLTIVAFGTSAPEIMVSISASLKGAGDMAVGNGIGSNIANTGLVLGATALVVAIPVQKHLLKDELPLLLVVMAISGYFLSDGILAQWEAIVLIGALIPAIFLLVYLKKGDLSEQETTDEASIPHMSRTMAFVWFVIGLGALMLSSEVLVWGAKSAAEMAGVSPLVIGLTIIALGTSLPELAASLISALKGHHDIALGNVLGSNMFNLLAVMSIPGLSGSFPLDQSVFSRDFVVMLALTILLAVAIGLSIWRNRGAGGGKIGKTAGCLLLLSYFGYYVLLYQTAI